MAIYPELRQSSLATLIDRFWDDAPDGSRYAFGYYAEVAEAIRDAGEEGIAFLLKVVHGVESVRRRAIVAALADATPQRGEARELLIASIRDTHPLVVAEAIDGLAGLGDAGVREEVLDRRAHRSPYVRAAVIRYFVRSGIDEPDARLVVNAGLSDAHYVVRAAAVDAVAEMDLEQAAATLQRMLHDRHPQVRAVALQAIENLAVIGRVELAGAANG